MKSKYEKQFGRKVIDWIEKYQKSFIIILFVAYFGIGLAVVKDYGVSWDEPTERFTSLWQYKFAVSKLFHVFGHESELLGEHMYLRQMLHGYPDRYYGTFLHWPLVAIEHISGFTMDNDEIFLIRHINTFLYFFVAVICFYLLLKKRFNSWKYALLGTGFLVITPRFFAESFYNNKDILFAAWSLITIYFSFWFIDKRNIWRMLILGIILGIGLNTRIVAGIYLPMIMFWSLVAQYLKNKSLVELAKNVVISIGFGLIAVAVFVLTNPTSWGNEFTFLPEVFEKFSHYTWFGKTVYLNGFAYWDSIPWHFIPVYMWATTPLWYSVLFILGVISLGIALFNLLKKRKNIFSSDVWKYDVFMFACFLSPLLLVIVMKSVLYDSWRHMYFIYPSFIYLAVLAVYNWQKMKKALVLGSLITLIITSVWMVKNHPYQFLYFNEIARANASDNFERDYWGLVSIDMIDFILANDDREKIKIWQHDFYVKHIDLMISKEKKDRFVFVDDRLAADYRSHLFHNTRDKSWDEPDFVEIKSIDVDGVRAQSLYKKK